MKSFTSYIPSPSFYSKGVKVGIGLAQVIAELDEKKREALEKTWLKVNADFGSIFSTLLPGTAAKLEPPEGASFLDGPPPACPLAHCRQLSDFP